MYRNILALSCLVFSFSLLLRSLPTAHALPVGMSNDSFAYETFSGQVGGGATASLLAVPSDQIFVVTTAIFDGSNSGYYCDLNADSTQVYGGYSRAASYNSATALTQGRSHIPIASGTTLKVVSLSSACYYHIEGYYAAP